MNNDGATSKSRRKTGKESNTGTEMTAEPGVQGRSGGMQQNLNASMGALDDSESPQSDNHASSMEVATSENVANCESTEDAQSVDVQIESASLTTSKTKAKEKLEGDDLAYIKKLMDALKEENVDGAKAMIRDKKNTAVVSSAIWSIIPLLTKFVNTETMEGTYPMYEGCIKMLKNVSKIADCEDLVLCLLQELQQSDDDELFLSLLKPLQTSLIRLPKKRTKFIGWSLHSTWRYLMKLPSPENYNLEEDEKPLMDADPVVDRVTSIYFESLPFYDPFVIEYRRCKNKEQLEIKNLLIRYMTNSLDKPFAYLDLEVRNNTKSRARRVAERIVENVTTLMPDIYTFLEFRTERNDNKLIRDLALGVFYYLCLCENQHFVKAPKVYNPIYVFQNALHFCVALLKANSQFSVERGLILSQRLLDSVKNDRDLLNHQLLDSQVHSRFCKVITSIMVMNPIKDIRTKSLHVFNDYLHLFNSKGCYLIVINLGQILTSANVKAYLLGLYKEMWHKEFAANESHVSPYFSGYKLLTLLKLFCYLHQKEESDLIELADQIIGCLNVLRYMVLRDKKNVSKIWDYIPELTEIFLEPLKRGILLSKVHYEARIKDVVKESGIGDKNRSVVSVSIDGMADLHNNMAPGDKMKVLQAALTTFDVMDSILCCLNEDIAKGQSAQ